MPKITEKQYKMLENLRLYGQYEAPKKPEPKAEKPKGKIIGISEAEINLKSEEE